MLLVLLQLDAGVALALAGSGSGPVLELGGIPFAARLEAHVEVATGLVHVGPRDVERAAGVGGVLDRPRRPPLPAARGRPR